MEIYIVIALLVIIAVSEMYRTYLGLKTPSKKEHFKRKLRGTREMIWDFQFKIFKTREIREGIRQEYDYLQSRLMTVTQQLESKDLDKETRATLEDQEVLLERDATRFLAQMKHLDLEVEGAKPSLDNPDGHEGISMQIENLRELEKMLEEHINAL